MINEKNVLIAAKRHGVSTVKGLSPKTNQALDAVDKRLRALKIGVAQNKLIDEQDFYNLASSLDRIGGMVQKDGYAMPGTQIGYQEDKLADLWKDVREWNALVPIIKRRKLTPSEVRQHRRLYGDLRGGFLNVMVAIERQRKLAR